MADFIFMDSKITVNGDYRQKIIIFLLLGGKVMTKLASMLKRRDITLPIVIPLVKGMVFLVVMYRFESCTIKKAECQRIDAFKLWC